MLFLGHFVVNWSEQLAVMQVMELLFSFHLRGFVPVCAKAKRGLAGYEKEPQQEEIQRDDGQSEGNIKPEHSEGICTGASCFFKHLPTPFTFIATNLQSGICTNFSKQML